MAQSNTPVPPPMNLSHSMLHNPTFIQHTQIIDQRLYIRSGERPGYARLLENVATSALHDSVDNVDPPKCHPNTRVAIIENIHDWTLGKIEGLSRKSILWLKGGAGAGKSAIARSVAERCSDEGLLLGTFFFGAADSTRNHVGKLVATLSYQISLLFPEFRDTVAAIIEDDPLVFGRSIRTQFFTLIVRPLSAVLANLTAISNTTPRLIIIDGLDECSAVDSQRNLVLTLQELVTSTTTLIRFLVCSRPESHLNNTFSLSHMAPIIYKIFLNDDYAASNDIRLYLEDKFKHIRAGHSFNHLLPDPWPTPRMVYDLVEKASGQFIYAVTVVRYIESPRHRPDERLNVIFQLRPPFKDIPFAELDALYRLIISKAEDLPTVLDILAFPALYGKLTGVRDIEAILQLGQGGVEVLLADLHSIITIDHYGCVRFLHKSLGDFLDEPQRAGDLYRDLSRAQLFHIARVISYFSTPRPHQGAEFDKRFTRVTLPIGHILAKFYENPDITKADCVSSDILEAVDLFPTFSFFVPMLGHHSHWHYDWHLVLYSARDYFSYLYFIKDVCESTKIVYSEQMRQYCKCVLAVLDDDYSGHWKAHFLYAYYHLWRDPRHSLLERLSSRFDVMPNFEYDCAECRTFSYSLSKVMGSARGSAISDDIIIISYDLTEGDKQASIFAMSASYCLASLCDKQSAGPDWHLMRETSLSETGTEMSVPVEIRENVREYIFLMDLLPHILSLAGRYEPLVDMCRNKSFSSQSQLWPKKSGRARQAIDSYLHRMDS
ncbi:hypothetical protein CPC08DRAFT_767009 [Agrocybe pediades]|nr:hypothetical protein CPC08DRAFT_767009 [Agrocybe pediades]